MLWYLLFTQKGSKMSEKSIERDTWDGIFVFHIWYGQHNTGSTCKYHLKNSFICENYAKLWYYSNLVFFVSICKDLSEYKYDRVVTKSLDILNKLYSSQEDMFKLADRAQVFKGIEFLFSSTIFFGNL